MKTPCIFVCKTENDICVGCHRTLTEIILWSNYTDDERDIIMRRVTMSEASLAKINERLEVYRYSNGYMVEVSGRSEDGDWASKKMIFATADEAYGFAKEIHTSLPLDN